MNKDINKFVIKSSQELFKFLEECFPDYSHKKIKMMLSHGLISINGVLCTQFNQMLKRGQILTINDGKFYGKVEDNRLVILYEDDDLIAVSKPAGLLSVSTEKVKDNTMFHIVSNYVKQKNNKNKIFVIHRLDKDTSGILIFAKSEKVKHMLQDHWDQAVKNRIYIAVVCGSVKEETGVIKSYLATNEALKVYSTSDSTIGKLAITRYKKLKEKNGCSWLEVSLETGRKNQIRVHMSDIGHCVAGDKKYGCTKDPFKRLGLHAYILEFIHPITKKVIKIVAPIPNILK
ncbi:MAG: RluA family pseudouridine synthase [Bacilli bacterium]